MLLPLVLATTMLQDADLGNTVKRAVELQRSGKYLAAVEVLRTKFENGSRFDKKILNWPFAIALAYVEETAEARAVFDPKAKADEDDSIPPHCALETAKAVPALEEIVRQARDKQIVMINEAHHEPRHRAFSSLVARALRPLGFEYFAAETFLSDAPALLRKGPPIADVGEYTIEPFFGDLVRQVVQLGYKPVAYESAGNPSGGGMDEIVNSRDQGEAENLVKNILKAHPHARILIHCGYSHIMEKPQKLKNGQEFIWLANRLKKLTGIDPLTIDQVGASPHSRIGLDIPEYRWANAHGLIAPTVFMLGDGTSGVFGMYRGAADIQVFHPIEKTVNGRPDWMAMNGYRHPAAIPEFKIDAPTLVQAFRKSEPANAIPVDQVMVKPGAAMPSLMLPAGTYRIVLQDLAGVSRILSKEMVVK